MNNTTTTMTTTTTTNTTTNTSSKLATDIAKIILCNNPTILPEIDNIIHLIYQDNKINSKDLPYILTLFSKVHEWINEINTNKKKL